MLITGNVCFSKFPPCRIISNDPLSCDTDDKKQEKLSRQTFIFSNDDNVSGKADKWNKGLSTRRQLVWDKQSIGTLLPGNESCFLEKELI